MKNYLKLITFFITILLFTNCEKENFIEEPLEASTPKGTQINYINEAEIPQIINSITSLTGQSSVKINLKGGKSINYKKAIVDLENILKVKNKDNITNYTFGIDVEAAPINEFYNLVVNESPSGKIKKPYVVKYVVDDDALDNFMANKSDFKYFKGMKYILSFDSFFEKNDVTITKNGDPCPDDGTHIDLTGGGTPGSDGNFYNMGPYNHIQTDANRYDYADYTQPGISFNLFFNSYNTDTNDQTTHMDVVTNNIVTTTVGATTIETFIPNIGLNLPSPNVQVYFVDLNMNSGLDSRSGGSSNALCKVLVVCIDTRGNITTFEISCSEAYKRGQITKAAGDCPEDDGEVGIQLPGRKGDCYYLGADYYLGPDGMCYTKEALNNNLSEQSPFNVDVSKVLDSISLPTVTDSMRIASEKFLCAYTKLTTSNSFKNLFINTFGSSENFNVTFEIVPTLEDANGNTGGTATFTNGDFTGIDLTIKMNAAYINSNSTMAVVKTILHESIHAYLKLKLKDCNAGTSLDYIDNLTLGETIKVFYDNFNCNPDPIQGQHEFIFDHMLPTFQNVLKEIGYENLTSQASINGLSDYDLQILNQLIGTNISSSHMFDWNELYYYLSLAGLHKSDAFKNEIENDNTKYNLFKAYSYIGEKQLSKDCGN